MSKKKDGSGGHLITTLAIAGVPLLLRKVAATVWTKVVGKEPPTDLTDPKVTFPEALGWAIAMAIIVESARFGITRSARHRSAAEAAATAESD
jgi:Protein of unknown function (DUF4235)